MVSKLLLNLDAAWIAKILLLAAQDQMELSQSQLFKMDKK
jgi:hypothetical protein